VAKFKQSVAQGLGQWLSVVLPIPQFRQTREDGGEIIRVASLEFIQELSNWLSACISLVKLYTEFHLKQHHF
jgi:hypothetical protein